MQRGENVEEPNQSFSSESLKHEFKRCAWNLYFLSLYLYSLHKQFVNTVESRSLKPSVSRTSQYLQPNLVYLGFASLVILPSISRTPDFSNQFAFPLEVQEIGIPLYSQCNWPFIFLRKSFHSGVSLSKKNSLHRQQGALLWNPNKRH